MSKNLRVKTSKFIDETSRVSFKFNGTDYFGFKGDTLASALLSNDVHLVGRSFKYHRPRGIMTAGSEEPSAIVQINNNTDLTFNKLVIGITDFNELVDIVESLFPIDAPFSKNIRYRGERTVAIRQVTYTIGVELGLSYSHMVKVLNNRHGAKVSHHSNMIHAVAVVTNGVQMGDRVILSVWNKIMETLNSRKENFVNLPNWYQKKPQV